MKNARKYLGILACAFLYSSVYLLPYVKYVFYDAVLEVTGFTNTQVGFCLSVYILACICSTIPGGWLADKYAPKKLLVLSGAGHTILSFLALVFVRNYYATLAIFFGFGITSMLGFWSPVFKAVSMVGTEEEQGKFYGWFEGLNGLGSMIFNFLALWVFSLATNGSAAGLKGVYIFYTASTLISTIMVATLYKADASAAVEENAAPRKIATTKEIFAVLKMPRVWLFSIMAFGVYGFYAGSSYLTPYFSTVLGVSVVFSGSLATLKNYGTRLVGAPIAGVICDKIGRLKFLIIGFVITIALMIAFMMMPASASVLIPVMVLMFALALVNVSMKGVQFSVLDEVGVDQSVNGMAIALGTLIGYNLPDLALHPIFGKILDSYEPVTAYKIIFAALLGMLCLGFVACISLFAIKKKDTKAAAAAAES